MNKLLKISALTFAAGTLIACAGTAQQSADTESATVTSTENSVVTATNADTNTATAATTKQSKQTNIAENTNTLEQTNSAENTEPSTTTATAAAQTESATSVKADTSTVSFFAIGDVLFHTPLFKACKEDSSKCNFDYVFAPWKKDIQAADIAVVNQETVFVPREDGYASYPSFGSPEEVGLAEIDAGFDIITHATNHTIDRRAKAVDYTYNFWKDKPAKALGIHPTQADHDSVYVHEKNGIRFAFVNYTYGLNGQKLPDDRPYLVDLLDSAGEWVRQIEKAESKAEVTVAFMHFGTEYTDIPTKEAMRYAEQAIDAGADILVCAHPHVVEPYGIYTTKAGNKALIYWSLGNFISNQQQIETNLGGVAKFTVRKVKEGSDVKLEVLEAKFEGSVTQQEVGNYHAIPLFEYTNALANKHLLKAKIPEFSRESLQKVFDKAKVDAKRCETEDPDGKLPLPIQNFSAR